MTPFQKQWIDRASYQDLIDKIRTEPAVSEWFQDECGQYLFAALHSWVDRLVAQDTREFEFLKSSSAGPDEQIYMRA